MARVESSGTPSRPLDMTLKYVPPKLPTYLANTFDLKPVVGVPTDNEVKAIHAVIRAVETASQIPALCDPGLSIDLAQHLFDVQMARYRDRYPVNIFPSSNTYTPPTLPSHINVPLKSVTGPPSDQEVKLVYTALRASENSANLPSIFDPDLSMNLSQHLFDIQFARYIQRTTEGHYATHKSMPDTDVNQNMVGNVPPHVAEHPVGYVSDTVPVATPETGRRGEPVSGSEREGDPSPQAPSTNSRTHTLTEDTQSIIEQLKSNQEQTDRCLLGIQDALKDGLKDGLKDAVENVTRMMIKLHNHSARGFNSGELAYHHIVDGNGDAPFGYPAPWLKGHSGYHFWKSAADNLLAKYLLFYGLGLDLVQEGDSPTLKPGSHEAAVQLLGKNTHSREPN